MKGLLKAASIEAYYIYNNKGEKIYRFEVKSVKKRRKIDKLQGTVIDFDKDIKPLLK